MRRIVNAWGITAVVLLAVMSPASQAADEITIGAVQSITGRLSYAGVQIDAGLRDALSIANDDGGINGKKITYIREDGQYKLDVARAAFDGIISRYKPLIMYGESKALTEAVAPEIQARYKVLYTSASFSAEFAQPGLNPYVFVAGPTDGDMPGILLKYIAREKPHAKVALFYSDSEFGRDPVPFARIMCRRLRLKLVAEATAPVDAIDVSSQIDDLIKKQPDYVVLHGFVLDPIKAIVGQSRVMGFKPVFVCTFWAATKELLERMGSFAEGLIAVSPYMYWWNTDVPMIKKIRSYNEKHYPYVTFRENSYMPGFMTGLIFVECLKRADKAGQLNGEGLVKALQSLKDFDSGGLSAPFTVRNNRFPVARIWRANVKREIFEPVSEWIRLGRYQ